MEILAAISEERKLEKQLHKLNHQLKRWAKVRKQAKKVAG
jgi:hypothetical protein